MDDIAFNTTFARCLKSTTANQIGKPSDFIAFFNREEVYLLIVGGNALALFHAIDRADLLISMARNGVMVCRNHCRSALATAFCLEQPGILSGFQVVIRPSESGPLYDGEVPESARQALLQFRIQI